MSKSVKIKSWVKKKLLHSSLCLVKKLSNYRFEIYLKMYFLDRIQYLYTVENGIVRGKQIK